MPLEREEEEFGIYSFQFITSPSHITYCVVLQCKPELSYGHMFTLTKLKLRKQQTESIISDFLIYTSNGKLCIAIPIYTVLPYCVINKQYLHHSFTDYIHMYIYLLYFAWANQTHRQCCIRHTARFTSFRALTNTYGSVHIVILIIYSWLCVQVTCRDIQNDQ